jgi:type I restriction enzyme M protein
MNVIHNSFVPTTTNESHRLLRRIYKAMAHTYPFPAALYHTAALLLLRTITTRWQTQQALYRQRHGADSPWIPRLMTFYRFQLPETCSFDYLVLRRHDDDLPALATLALRQLDTSNPDTLQGIFHDIDLDDTRPGAVGTAAETIRLALKYLSNPAFDANTGDAFQYLLETLASARENRDKALYVPTAVSSLIVLLAAPRAGERICDPICGCGALLIPALLHTRKHALDAVHNFSAYGQEHDRIGFRLTRLRTHLHDLAGVRLEHDSSITAPRFHEAGALTKFDVVIASLMPSLEHWGYTEALADRHQRFCHGLPPKSKGEYAYIQHILATLAPEGRAVILLAQHALSRGGLEARIRQSLVEANVIDAVITLPANLFPDTAAATAVLILRPSRIRREILLIDARQHFQPGRKQYVLRPSDITRITTAYTGYQHQDDLAVCVASEEIAYNNFNLSAASYLHRDAPTPHADPVQLQQEINQLHLQLRQTRSALDTLLAGLQNAPHDARSTPYILTPDEHVVEEPYIPYTHADNLFARAIREAFPSIPNALASMTGTAIQVLYQQRIIRDWRTNTDWQRDTDRCVEQLLYTFATEKGLALPEPVCDVIRTVCREAATRFFR